MIETKLTLGTQDVPEIKRIRAAAYPEFSGGGIDGCAIHALVYDGGTAASTGRLYHDGVRVWLDGVCTLPQFRRRGYADLAIRLLLYKASQSAARELFIAPPEFFAGSFLKFGFTPCEEGMKLDMDDLVFPRKCGGEK